MTAFTVVLVTVPNVKEGERLAKTLVAEHLAACVNIVPGVKSVYRWEGKVESSQEQLLLIKTGKAKLKALEKRIKLIHSYTVPEIISLPIEWGEVSYLKWLGQSVVTQVKPTND